MHPGTKLGLGLLVAAALLLGGEALARLVLGPPPPPPELVRISVAKLVVEGDEVRLSHAVDPRQDLRFPRQKGPRPRLVVLGGSSVRHTWQGDPEANFPTPLQRALPEVEVLNLGSPGQSSTGLARLVQDLHLLQPDLVLVYSGHNDFSQPLFQGELGAHGLWVLPVYGVLGQSWFHASLRKVPRGLAPAEPGHRPVLLPTSDDRARGWRPETLARLEENLGRIIEQSTAPVALATLLRNFDHPPTGVLLRPEHPGCEAELSRLPTRRLQDPGREALVAAQACGEDSAITAWYRAQEAAREGDLETARSRFADSLRLDPLPLRAPFEADEAIRRAAARSGARVIDLAEALGPVARDPLFDDTLHPSPEGARRIAEVLAPHLREALAGRVQPH